MNAADVAMYHAKADGPGNYRFSSREKLSENAAWLRCGYSPFGRHIYLMLDDRFWLQKSPIRNPASAGFSVLFGTNAAPCGFDSNTYTNSFVVY
jgi:hypothetical protein